VRSLIYIVAIRVAPPKRPDVSQRDYRTIVSRLGAAPDLVSAVGVGYGLERLAMLRYRIDDVRKIELAGIG
jgi:hypothetical protein